MLLAGDEFGRTQHGNNNAYCQDNEISWIDWSALETESGRSMHDFVRGLIALRHNHIVFHRDRFFLGGTIPGTDVQDVVWLRPDGNAMTPEDWGVPHAKALGLLMSGEAGLMHVTERGVPLPDDTFLMLMNAGDQEVTFTLPDTNGAPQWSRVFDTGEASREKPVSADTYDTAPRSFVLLRRGETKS